MNTQPALICFALCVLRVLEESEDWSADTLAEIASDAVTLELATSDDEGNFIRTTQPERG